MIYLYYFCIMRTLIKFVCVDNTLGSNRIDFNVNDIYYGYIEDGRNTAMVTTKNNKSKQVTLYIDNKHFFTSDTIIVRNAEIQNILK